jgi:DNA-binding PadR family transcriptional regulator
MAQDRERVDRFLPLKPFVLDVLLELADGKRHGWSLIRDIQQRDGGTRILPANFYRTLRRAARGWLDRRSQRRCQRRSR